MTAIVNQNFKLIHIVRKAFPLVLLITIVLFVECGRCHSQSQSTKLLQGTVNQNELIDDLERTGIKCILSEERPHQLIVSKVRLGSKAYFQGITAGDAVESLQQKDRIFLLTVKRSGKLYQATFNLNLRNVQSATNLANATVNSGFVPFIDIPGKLSRSVSISDPRKSDEILLADFDIEVILDTTGSMNSADGTGLDSKFEWCHQQVRNLAERLTPLKKTLTITTFADNFFTMKNCDPSKVEQLLGSINPMGGTNLRDPLISRCEACHMRFRQTKKPQIIAIVSDGEPNIPPSPMEVNQALVDFSQNLTVDGELTLVFLQIGDTFSGRAFCLDLQNNLLNEGAKFSFVKTITFDELKRRGIVNVLIGAVQDNDLKTTASEKHLKKFVEDLPPSRVRE